MVSRMIVVDFWVTEMQEQKDRQIDVMTLSLIMM